MPTAASASVTNPPLTLLPKICPPFKRISDPCARIPAKGQFSGSMDQWRTTWSRLWPNSTPIIGVLMNDPCQETLEAACTVSFGDVKKCGTFHTHPGFIDGLTLSG